MARIQFFYRLDTRQIDAVFKGCRTNSTVFKDANVYGEVNVEDPPYEVTRDRIVVLDGGQVMGTAPSINPIQPKPTPVEYPKEMVLRSPDGSAWAISVDNSGNIEADKKAAEPIPEPL